MATDLFFDLPATLTLAEHAAAAACHARSSAEHIDNKTCPGALAWVADQGTYLMSTGLPGLPVNPDDPTASTQVVVWAEGWGPDSDRAALAATGVGHDDFCEHIHLDESPSPGVATVISMLRAGQVARYRYLVIHVTEESYSLRLSRGRPRRPRPAARRGSRSTPPGTPPTGG
jgi:hypothetical protein